MFDSSSTIYDTQFKENIENFMYKTHIRKPTVFRHNPRNILEHLESIILNSLEKLVRPTQRAGHAQFEPRVNAFAMEHVTTIRDQLHDLSLLKLAQADGAFLHHLLLRVRHQRQGRRRGGCGDLRTALLVRP